MLWVSCPCSLSFHLNKPKEAYCKHCDSLPGGFSASQGEVWAVRRTSQEFASGDAQEAASPGDVGGGENTQLPGPVVGLTLRHTAPFLQSHIGTEPPQWLAPWFLLCGFLPFPASLPYAPDSISWDYLPNTLLTPSILISGSASRGTQIKTAP